MALTKLQAESLNLADTYAFTGTVSGASTPMTPAFMAYVNGNQSISSSTDTLVAFNSEVFDTNNAYTNTASNYKFTVPTGEAGRYFIYARLTYSASTSNRIRIFKNGSFLYNNYYESNSNGSIDYSTIMDLSANDYIQIYAFATASATLDGSEQRCVFMAYKIIE